MQIFIVLFSEIYKIVSQKQIRDSPDDEHQTIGGVQTITVSDVIAGRWCDLTVAGCAHDPRKRRAEEAMLLVLGSSRQSPS